MRWEGRRQSKNVEDRRGAGPKMAIGGGLGMIVLYLILMFLGIDPSKLLSGGGGGGPTIGVPTDTRGSSRQTQADPREEERKAMVATVLADTEDVWGKIFRESGKTYVEPTLVFFSGQVRSACGYANAAVGPFYCPGDQKVYIDLSFFDQLERRFDAPGDFAQAYVIAHEVGHHVQNLLGLTEFVHSKKGRVSQSAYNDLSVRLELQADFLAGVWAHHAHEQWRIIEEGDIEEAIRAASAIGDDAIQKKTQGYVVPDSFTHGTSEQRMRWFYKGLESGDLRYLDTFFEADEL